MIIMLDQGMVPSLDLQVAQKFQQEEMLKWLLCTNKRAHLNINCMCGSHTVLVKSDIQFHSVKLLALGRVTKNLTQVRVVTLHEKITQVKSIV